MKDLIKYISQALVDNPDQVEVMAPTRDAVVTLISCYPYMVDKQRIIVVADLQDER